MSEPVEYTIFTGAPDGRVGQRRVAKTARADDVVIRITHSGLCYTDVHQKHRDIALGHEGAGVIVQIGPNVQKLKVGDRVGFGMLRGTCGSCRECLEGEDIYCPAADLYAHRDGDALTGSLASHALVREAFAFLLPAAMPSAHAAPFMCAGASCFEPLLRGGVRAGDRVGVLGLGGLGHMAVQLARAMGCVVVVLSSSESKREEAMRLGACEFVVTRGVERIEGVEQLKHLLVVSSAQPDWRVLTPLLAPRASIFMLTFDGDATLDLPLRALITKGLRVHGKFIAPRSVYAPMLAFAAAHGIAPVVQEFPMTPTGVEQAFAELEAGRVRYRAVLVAEEE